MNDPENFLARWSRRKREIASPDVTAIEQAAEPKAAAANMAAPEASGALSAELETEMAALTPPEDKSSNPTPAFDPASLPSLDSIGADTDIRGFLAPGVPTELAHAALRRVWTADPGIRDFKGLAEYDWDFTKPGSMFGFGELDPGTDVKQMLADVFGELTRDADAPTENVATETPSPTAAEPELSALSEPDAPEIDEVTDETAAASNEVFDQQQEDELLHRNVNIAMQNDVSANDEDQPMLRQRHGGALPQ